jgi:hypothetical protein
LTPSDVQEGVTGGSGTRLLRADRAGEHVKRAARAIVGTGLALRGPRSNVAEDRPRPRMVLR